MAIHTPVLLAEVMQFLSCGEQKCLSVDARLGEGGHAEAMLSLFPGMKVLGVEADGDILKVARERLKRFGKRIETFHSWSLEFFKEYGQRFTEFPDRIFIDLGISMFHYRQSGRGFSFREDEPLDMRIDREQPLTAGIIVNEYGREELEKLILEYGEERFAGRISRSIIRERSKGPIRSAKVLGEIIKKSVPANRRYGRINPATKTFQALRIVVNNELQNLREELGYSFQVLKIGGKMGVISFHSLEDRIVKHFFKEKNKSCTCPAEWPICQCGGLRELKILTGKAIFANAAEQEINPASRSARLRVVEKLR
ncbi:MAG: 16S rRNA (cytosine(1402)-N(4))-methyltransferase RsmH [Spirochaeta sp.]|nr:16S rRNA (cytosine(1402)-N(4))-methyltransferase RsmH [Spirochaeta sp.]